MKDRVNKINSSDRIIYFDFLRVIAIIAVIAIHTTSPRTSMEIGTVEWKTLTFYGNVVDWAVPVFVMISGALFLNPEKTVDNRRLFKNHILRMILVFIFWSPIYAVFDTYIYNPTMVRQNTMGLIARVFLGHSHMWFLYMIVGLYLLVPFLRKITEDWNLVKYFVLLSLLFTYIIPFTLWILQVADFFLSPSDSLYDFANQVYSKMNFHFTLGYLPFFVGGYFLHKAVISRRAEITIYLLAIVSAVLCILYTEYGSVYVQKDLIRLPYLPNVFQPAAVFVFAKKHMNDIRSSVTRKCILFCSKYSFCVYLIHYFVLTCFVWLIFDTTTFCPVISVPVIVMAVFIMSLLLSVLLHKIPVIRRYFV